VAVALTFGSDLVGVAIDWEALLLLLLLLLLLRDNGGQRQISSGFCLEAVACG